MLFPTMKQIYEKRLQNKIFGVDKTMIWKWGQKMCWTNHLDDIVTATASVTILDGNGILFGENPSLKTTLTTA